MNRSLNHSFDDRIYAFVSPQFPRDLQLIRRDEEDEERNFTGLMDIDRYLGDTSISFLYLVQFNLQDDIYVLVEGGRSDSIMIPADDYKRFIKENTLRTEK